MQSCKWKCLHIFYVFRPTYTSPGGIPCNSETIMTVSRVSGPVKWCQSETDRHSIAVSLHLIHHCRVNIVFASADLHVLIAE